MKPKIPRVRELHGELGHRSFPMSERFGAGPAREARRIQRTPPELLQRATSANANADYSYSVRSRTRARGAIALEEDDQSVEREHVVDLGDVAGVAGDLARQAAGGDDPGLRAQLGHHAFQNAVDQA